MPMGRVTLEIDWSRCKYLYIQIYYIRNLWCIHGACIDFKGLKANKFWQLKLAQAVHHMKNLILINYNDVNEFSSNFFVEMCRALKKVAIKIFKQIFQLLI